jgi:acyl carrier protein
MHDRYDDIVSLVLSRHLDVEPRRFEPTVRLHDELGLEPLDVVLVAIALEALVAIDFPIAALEFVETVDELTSIVRSSMRGAAERAA